MEYLSYYESPLGGITLAGDEAALTGLWFDGQRYVTAMPDEKREEKELPVFDRTAQWLDLYFAGQEPDFTPPLQIKTTPFRKRVWEILLTIPYGQTMTYAEIAKMLAQERGMERMSAQAVGGAVGHNAISLIIPCHRVIGSDGSLTGYAGGIWRKQKLLELERDSRPIEKIAGLC